MLWMSVLLAASSLPGACTASRTFVLDAPVIMPGRAGVALRHAPGTVAIADSAQAHFESELAAALAAYDQPVAPGDASITLRYRFVYFDRGNPAIRIGAGAASLLGSPFYGLGDGSVGVEATYIDLSGATIARIVADGPIAGAFASRDSGLEAAAESIAKFTASLFNATSTGEHLADEPSSQPPQANAPPT